MQPARILIALLVLSTGAACAPRSQQVALQATPADREAMSGAWRGNYTIDWRRGGTISFTLMPREDEAHGDVLMMPKGAVRPYGRSMPDGLSPQAGPVATSELLTIRFVRASDGHVTGALTPYWDPDRSCVAQATFSGTIGRGAMSGTFVSTCDRGAPTYTGRWSMRRVS
jgi:hypothetical protein